MKKLIFVILMLICVTLNAFAVAWHSNQVFYCDALARNMSYDIAVPDDYSTNSVYPVLYLLHGRNYHYECWREESLLLNNLANHNYQMLVVMPEGDYSWYMGAWETYIANDLPNHIATLWKSGSRQGLGGFSMGGYGAFNVAGQAYLNFGRTYNSVSSMSGAFVEPGISEALDSVTIRSPSKIASYLARTPSSIFFDCGNEDNFKFWGLDYNLADHNDNMRDLLIDDGRLLWKNLFYYRPPGEHDWAYWNQRLPEHTKFHNKYFVSYPEIYFDNLDENKTTTLTSAIYRVEGHAFSADGINRVTWQNKANGQKFTGLCTGTTNWYAIITNSVGKNELTFSAYSFSETNSSIKANIFLRDYSFRVRKIVVKDNLLFAKTSDITHGDVQSLTSGKLGNGIFKLGGYTRNITNLYWKSSGDYNCKYKYKDDNIKIMLKVKGKAQKDQMLFKFKLYNTNNWPHTFNQVINFNTTNALDISFGKYNGNTNLFIDEKGKYKYKGSWF